MDTPLLSIRVKDDAQEQGRTFARRSELEVKMDILRVVGEGCRKPTQIMYKANLSWIALQEHFKSLVDSGLLRVEKFGKRTEYDLTSSGLAILQDYRKLTGSIKKSVVSSPAF